jgi:hypothetical protein
MSIDYIAWKGRMAHERRIRGYFKGSGFNLIEELFCHMPGLTEENHGKLQSGYPMSRQKFEPRTSQIRAKGATATPTCSV